MRYLIGIGTYLGQDDSVGLRVAEAIAEAGLERGFRAIVLAGDLLDVIHYLDAGTEDVLVVDSARMGLAPGEHRFFTPDAARTAKPRSLSSTHGGDLLQVLALASALAQETPSVTIMGIEPERVSRGDGLSPALQQRFDEYVEAAVGFFAEP